MPNPFVMIMQEMEGRARYAEYCDEALAAPGNVATVRALKPRSGERARQVADSLKILEAYAKLTEPMRRRIADAHKTAADAKRASAAQLDLRIRIARAIDADRPAATDAATLDRRIRAAKAADPAVLERRLRASMASLK